MSCDWLNLGLQDPRITGSNDPITGTNDPDTSWFDLPLEIRRHDPAAGIAGVRHHAGRRLYVPAEPLGDPLSGIADDVSSPNRPRVIRRPLKAHIHWFNALTRSSASRRSREVSADANFARVDISRSRASARPDALPPALTRRAMLIAVRNSQPTAPIFLAEASERLNKRMAARSSRNGSRHSSEPWIR